MRERAGARGAALTANERTAKKKVALSEALGRFEKRLDQLEASERRGKRDQALAARAPSSSPPGANRATRRATARKPAGGQGRFMSSSAQAKATKSRRAPQTRIIASRAAAGRRGQAKRDSR